MRILLVALAPSHLLCMVPLAWAARAAGHEVAVAGRAPVADAARRAGLCSFDVAEIEVATAPSAAEKVAEPKFERMAALLTEQQRSTLAGREWTPGQHPWERRVAAVLDGYLAAARTFRADLILCDPLEYAGLVLGGVLDIPVVVQRWGGPDSLSTEGISRARGILADLCVHVGVEGGLPEPALAIDPCPPSLRPPAAAPATPMRFVPYNGARPLPQWARGRDDRRLVSVSFGLFGTQAALRGDEFVKGGELAKRYRMLAETLAARTDVDAVFSVPPEIRAELGDLPGHVRTPDWIPLDSLLRAGDLVIHHGGIGTAMTACVNASTQLVLPPAHPVFLECAAGLTARGVARSLDESTQDDPALLAEAVHGLLDSDVEAERARELAVEIAAQPSPAQVVAEDLNRL